ncbi:MAG: general secretion pathway protein GspC [Polyangiaceae bacterium]|nr:general secretion pathway protein GspC [Polyangiaceae bacterium]
MGFDAKLKRFYPLVLCGLIALVALFQSRGIGQLVGATIAEGGGAVRASTTGKGTASKTPKRPSAKALLARNPFDSVTGPVDGTSLSIPPTPDEGEPGHTASGDPTADPDCDYGRVIIITASEDPDWSFAAFDNSGSTLLRRRGQEVQGAKVEYIGSDTVWMSKGGARCKIRLRDRGRMARAAPAKPGAAAAPGKAPASRGALSPEMASKIKKVSETEYAIDRSLVDEILENQAELMKQARIVPEKEGDKVVGVRMFGIRSGSLLNTLGFKNGDRLDSINGMEITDPQKALEAYGRLRAADRLSVALNRKGAPVSIEFNIQ